MPLFSVTYEQFDESDIEAGDTDKRGFVVEGVSLREACRQGLEYRQPSWAGACEPSDSRVDHARWLTFYDWNEGTRDRIERGIHESRSLHFPESLTPSSRRRIARLFNAYGV